MHSDLEKRGAYTFLHSFKNWKSDRKKNPSFPVLPRSLIDFISDCILLFDIIAKVQYTEHNTEIQ